MTHVLAFTWGEAASVLGILVGLCTVASFVGAWLGRQFKERHMVTQTRADLDRHLEEARAKERSIMDMMGTLQSQSIRNGEQIANVASHLHEVAETVEKTAESVNILRGVVSTVFRQGTSLLENGV